jgi:hypothetical protein
MHSGTLPWNSLRPLVSFKPTAIECFLTKCSWESEDRERKNKAIHDNFNEYFNIWTNSNAPSVKATVTTPVPQDYKDDDV